MASGWFEDVARDACGSASRSPGTTRSRRLAHATQDPVVADEMEARRRDRGGEPLQELEGLEDDVGRAVPPAVLEAVEEAAVLHAREALC
jgi:hypothetical protein